MEAGYLKPSLRMNTHFHIHCRRILQSRCSPLHFLPQLSRHRSHFSRHRSQISHHRSQFSRHRSQSRETGCLACSLETAPWCSGGWLQGAARLWQWPVLENVLVDIYKDGKILKEQRKQDVALNQFVIKEFVFWSCSCWVNIPKGTTDPSIDLFNL